MIDGKCRLCDKNGRIVESDIWPRFGYKLYAADQAHGGVFADLKELKIHGKRLTSPLFCEECDNKTISRLETRAARFCRDLDKAPEAPIAYGEWFLPFVTSLCLRTLLNPASPPVDQKAVAPAVRNWRQLILGKRGNPGLYTQHVFIVFDKELGTHMGMCGWCEPDSGFVFTQFGPLWTVGLLRRDQLSRKDIRAWQHSQISPTGGMIQPVKEWREDVTISTDFIRFLFKRRSAAIEKAQQYAAKQAARNRARGERRNG